MRNNYNLIAPWYDFLSSIVFGQKQIVAQTILLPYIKENSRILIVGGGSGWILESIAKRYGSGLDITYVEYSEKMMELSRQREVKKNKVVFINQAIEDYIPTVKFDVVFTAFLFDNFQGGKAHDIFYLLHGCLLSKGQWFFVDFQYDPSENAWWQGLLLKCMLGFFKIISQIEATTLVDMEPHFIRESYTIVFKQLSFKSFIRSAVYQKS